MLRIFWTFDLCRSHWSIIIIMTQECQRKERSSWSKPTCLWEKQNILENKKKNSQTKNKSFHFYWVTCEEGLWKLEGVVLILNTQQTRIALFLFLYSLGWGYQLCTIWLRTPETLKAVKILKRMPQHSGLAQHSPICWANPSLTHTMIGNDHFKVFLAP